MFNTFNCRFCTLYFLMHLSIFGGKSLINKFLFMETITLNNDLKVLYTEADSFPDGVMEAHKKLHALVPFSTERKYLGLLRPENGKIAYKAATEEIEKGEAEKLNCKTLVVKKGNYLSITIHDYMNNMQRFQQVFQELISQPGLNTNGNCVDWYLSRKEVKCMVRLKC